MVLQMGLAAEVLEVAVDHVVGGDGLLVVLVRSCKQLDRICELLLPRHAVLDVLLDLLQGVGGLGWVEDDTAELCLAGQRGEKEERRDERSDAKSAET